MIDTSQLFKQQLSQALNVVTVNHFSGIIDMSATASAARSAAAPADNAAVNTEDYRKLFNISPVLKWGAKNDFPNAIDEEAKASSVLEGGMKVLCDHLRGQEFFLYKFVYKDGKRIIEEVQDDEVLDELEAIGYYEYWYDACGEMPKWGNLWPVFNMNKNREIAEIKIFDGLWNRFERPRPENGKIENIFVSAQWQKQIDVLLTRGNIPDTLKSWVFKYPLLDRMNYADQLASSTLKKYDSFASHIKYHTSGSAYGRAPWHSLYLNRWLGISGKVPEMIMRYYEAAMTINYLIYTDSEWLLKKFPEFEDWDDETRAKKIKELQDSFEKNLKGGENAFKSLMLTTKTDAQGNEVKNVKFEPLENKIREVTVIPDSQVSDGQILFTLGVAPSLMGAVIPGGKGGEGGSGSNIREASLALQMRLKPDRDLIHNAFYIWRDYKFRDTKDRNKTKLMIGVRDYAINTLDGAPPASAQVTSPTQ